MSTGDGMGERGPLVRAGARKYARLYGPGLGWSVAYVGRLGQSSDVPRLCMNEISLRSADIREMSLMDIEALRLIIRALPSFSGSSRKTLRSKERSTFPQLRPETAVEVSTSCLRAAGGGHA